MDKVSSWRLILNPRTPGSQNMVIDKTLFKNLETNTASPALRIYSWLRPCISVGYSQTPENELDLSLCRELGIQVVKRPTGGGIVFHTKAEATYSFVIPFEREFRNGSPEILNKTSKALVTALSSFGIDVHISENRKRWNSRFCFSYPSRCEITANGRKIIGMAHRIGKRGMLQQASIFVDNEIDFMLKALKNPPPKRDITSKAASIRELIRRIPDFDELSRALIFGFEESFKVKLIPL